MASPSKPAQSNLRQRPLTMASQEQDSREDQPLLGHPGHAIQDENQSLWQNLYIGTAIVAQGGIIVLTVLVWVSVFTSQPIILFSAHPVCESLATFLFFNMVRCLIDVLPYRFSTPQAYSSSLKQSSSFNLHSHRSKKSTGHTPTAHSITLVTLL